MECSKCEYKEEICHYEFECPYMEQEKAMCGLIHGEECINNGDCKSCKYCIVILD